MFPASAQWTSKQWLLMQHICSIWKNIPLLAIPFLSLDFVTVRARSRFGHTTQSKHVLPSVTKQGLSFVNKLVNGAGAHDGVTMILKFDGNPFEAVLKGNVDFLQECLDLLAPKETIVKVLSLRRNFV